MPAVVAYLVSELGLGNQVYVCLDAYIYAYWSTHSTHVRKKVQATEMKLYSLNEGYL